MSKYSDLYPKKKFRKEPVMESEERDERPYTVVQFEAATAREEEHYAREIERLQHAVEELQPVEDPFQNGAILLVGASTNPVVFSKDESGVWHSQGSVRTWRSVLTTIRQHDEVRMVLSYRTIPGNEVVEVERKRQARKTTAKKAPATSGRKPMTEATKKAAAAKRAATIAAKKAASSES